uniref:2-isopropylmalate synthase LeuA allosteric (dimerisation) domain-containing protein n=1 Tax=Craspedostauros australis TaxID=1486917 RepID=A0A6T6E3E8_9STRA
MDYSAQVYDQRLDSASRVVSKEKTQSTNGQPAMLASSTTSTSRATVNVRTVVVDDGKTTATDGIGSSDVGEDANDQVCYRDTLEVADGCGPIDSLANALMRALLPTYPYLKNVELVDYKVRILDPASATNAATRVMIEFADTASEATWTTVSVDRNVISASLNALVDGVEYALVEHAPVCMLCDDAYTL